MDEQDEKSDTPPDRATKRRHMKRGGGMSSALYGLALIGAAVYYIQQSHTFWEGVLGILKAIVWPAMLMYKLLEFLKM